MTPRPPALPGWALATATVGLAGATTLLPLRWWTLLTAGAVLLLLSWGRSTAYVVACACLPFVAGLRRATAGPTGYLENDPLVLLPVVLALPAVLALLVGRANRRDSRLLLLVVAGLLLSWLVAIGGSPSASTYALAGQLTPVLVGLCLAAGQLSGLATTLRTVLLLTSPVVAAYGLLQRVAPPAWDLAWLADRQSVLTSVGMPRVGGFRIFGTLESPTPFALFLAVGTAAHLLAALSSARTRPRAATAHLLLGGLLVGSMALSSVRSALFALPVAVLVWLLASRRVSALLSVAVAGVMVALVLTVPVVLGAGDGAPGGSARFDVLSIAQDTSFLARLDLLPQFASAAGSPLGTGIGSVGRSSALAGEEVTIDNGYLARLHEQGPLGLLALVLVLGAAMVRGTALVRARRDDVADLSLMVVILFAIFELSVPTVADGLGFYFWPAVGYLFLGHRRLREQPHLAAANGGADASVVEGAPAAEPPDHAEQQLVGPGQEGLGRGVAPPLRA